MQQQQIDISTTTPVTCTSCGHSYFSEELILRKVSKLISNTGQEGVVPISVIVCSSCKTVCRETLPPQVDKVLFPVKMSIVR